MVQTGAISAKAAGISLPPQNITVNPRPGWGTSPVVPQNETTTGYPIAECTFVSPPPNTSATLGCSTYLMTYQTSIDRLLTIPSGPNQDFAYYTLDASYTQAFPWKMHPDVYYDTPFSLKQHGNCGYITSAQLRTNITWHESSNEPPSHYSLYKDALQMNNYGSYVEARVALPHESKLQFHATIAQQLQPRGQSVYNWAGPQNEHLLRRVNLNQATGLFEGEVNYPDPYDRLCNQ